MAQPGEDEGRETGVEELVAFRMQSARAEEPSSSVEKRYHKKMQGYPHFLFRFVSFFFSLFFIQPNRLAERGRPGKEEEDGAKGQREWVTSRRRRRRRVRKRVWLSRDNALALFMQALTKGGLMARPNKKLGELLRVTFIARWNWVIFETVEGISRPTEASPRIDPRDDPFSTLITAEIVFACPIARDTLCVH